MDEYPYPIGYGVSMCPAEAEPAFESAEQQELGWGREWGAHDEVGILRRVLVRSPGNEFERVRADCWDERAQALVDPEGGWYWESRDPPDLELIRSQHAGLVAALEAEGIEVVQVTGEAAPHLSRPRAPRRGRCRHPLRRDSEGGRRHPLLDHGARPRSSRLTAVSRGRRGSGGRPRRSGSR